MGLFGQSSPFEMEIEKATSEKNTTEPWGVIMDICDKVGSNPRNAKDCLKAIMKRMAHPDPHVVIQAITLLDACVNNCGKNFHLEVASREFENEFKRLLSKAQPQVAMKMRLLLKKWAENDFKMDPQLNLIPSLYHKLKSEGHDFTEANQKTTKTTPPAVLKDPNVVTSQQEEEDIAKAIELSLKDTKSSPKKQQTAATTAAASTYSSIYPSFSGTTALNTTTSGASSIQAQEPRKVRALYDFEAAEDNELTFAAGDIIHVLDDSDPNWWKGYNQKGEGLFPSNFVTADLSVEPERLEINQKTKKSVQFDDEIKDTEKTDIEDKLGDDKSYVPEINEEKIDRLLHLLHEANPEDPSQDSEEMLKLEDQVNKMGPLIDTELERVDRKHAQLTQLSSDLVDAINLYHTLMREPDRSNMPVMSGMFYPGYNPLPPPNLYGSSAVYGLQNSYYQSPTPTTQLGMSMMQTSLPGQIQQSLGPQQPPTVSHPTQMPISGGAGPNNFIATQTQAHMRYQNGHPPSAPGHFPSSQSQQQQQQQLPPQQPQSINHPQYQLQNQIQPASNPQQQIPNVMPSTNQPVSSQPQQQNTQPLPGTVTNTPINPNNFLPPNSGPIPGPGMFPSQAVNLIPNISNMLPQQIGPYHHHQQQQQQSPVISNGLMGTGSAISNQPQSLPYSTSSLPPLPQHPQMAAYTQPVTQTILGPNESKTIIPIHQQQR